MVKITRRTYSRQPMEYQKIVSPEEEIAEGFVNMVVANSFPKINHLIENNGGNSEGSNRHSSEKGNTTK